MRGPDILPGGVGRSDLQVPMLLISRRNWGQMCRELQRRGGGTKESGAFLLARADDIRGSHGKAKRPEITDVVYYDDLDPECLTGGITLSASAFDALWAICKQSGRRVAADVHTHPGPGVGQSEIDATNPMMALPGHVALIVGSFASGKVRPAQVGIHVYRGAHRWHRIPPAESAQVVFVGGAIGVVFNRWKGVISRRVLRRPGRRTGA